MNEYCGKKGKEHLTKLFYSKGIGVACSFSSFAPEYTQGGFFDRSQSQGLKVGWLFEGSGKMGQIAV